MKTWNVEQAPVLGLVYTHSSGAVVSKVSGKWRVFIDGQYRVLPALATLDHAESAIAHARARAMVHAC